MKRHQHHFLLLDVPTFSPQNSGRSHRSALNSKMPIPWQWNQLWGFFPPSSSSLNSPQSPADTRRQHTWWKKTLTAVLRLLRSVQELEYIFKNNVVHPSICTKGYHVRVVWTASTWNIRFTHSNSCLAIVCMLPEISTRHQSTPTDVVFTQLRKRRRKKHVWISTNSLANHSIIIISLKSSKWQFNLEVLRWLSFESEPPLKAMFTKIKRVTSGQVEQGELSHPTETMMWRIPIDWGWDSFAIWKQLTRSTVCQTPLER